MDQITKICCACKKTKELKSFYRNKLFKSGYDNKCKICKFEKKYCRQKQSKKLQKSSSLRLSNITEKDWIDMYNFLTSLGYDISGDIHLQFCEKHSLKPRNRMKEKSTTFSPKDLGLI